MKPKSISWTALLAITLPPALLAAPGNSKGKNSTVTNIIENITGSGTTSTSEITTVTSNLIPSTPVGTLSAYPTIVAVGAHPTLTWNIMYPSSVNDVVVINPPGSMITNEKNTYISVQPIGVGPTDCASDESSANRSVDIRMSVDGSEYFQLFYGTEEDVTPQYSLYIKKLTKAGTQINFGGRFVKNNNWTPFYTTRSSNMQVITLRDGDRIPTSFPLHTSPQLAGYLGPFLDENGRVEVGPMSVLVLMELGSTNHSQPCFDYQDAALLVTFDSRHPNNGHGNNLDGVDSSNPGKGVGGPTGLNNSGNDPSAGVDDEAK